MRLILYFILIFCTLNSFAINYPNEKPVAKLIKPNEIPNVKPILGNFLYMAETEVSNQEYRKYLNWLKKNRPDNYVASLPDSLKWRNNSSFCEPFVTYYFQHPAYKNYPLVNISQRQATKYCEWLHDSLETYFALNNSIIDSFVVRLPSTEEWMIAARGGLPESTIYPWEGNAPRITTGKNKDLNKWRLNCKASGIYWYFDIKSDFITTSVYSYWPNGFGLYNMSGNVAEWVSETGKTKGGSWNLPPYNARIDVAGFRDGDSTAAADIGFRYVIEIISLKNVLKPQKLDASFFKKHLKQLPLLDSAKNTLNFVGATEVSNSEYATFLVENNTPENQIQYQNWSAYFSYKYYEMYGKHSSFNDYPVVNISFQAAQAYCIWLTKSYNALEKRKYKKVNFRLPTAKEWQWMARGGNTNYMYPWGGPYCRNSRGCYLANFCPLEEQYYFKTGFDYSYKYPNNDYTISRGVDGAIIPVPIKSYFPNLLGLYNCSGNVAEMIAEEGISKGGSWNSNNVYISISSHETYSKPNVNTGFRLWMEVIEK